MLTLIWRRKSQPIPVFSPWKSQEQRNLVGNSTWDCKESDMTEHTHMLTLIITDLTILWEGI